MLSDFKKIIINIENKKYPLIGFGSGRNVYDLENGYVVKEAKNRRGFVQNKAEYQISSTDRSRLFAKVTAVSEDYRFLIMEKADKLESLSQVLNYFEVRNVRELFHSEELSSAMKRNNLLPADLHRYTSWGVIKGKPVIIDYGFTKNVSRYYNLFGFLY